MHSPPAGGYGNTLNTPMVAREDERDIGNKDSVDAMIATVRITILLQDILLHPPTDLPWIPYKDYQPALYERDHQKFSIKACLPCATLHVEVLKFFFLI